MNAPLKTRITPAAANAAILSPAFTYFPARFDTSEARVMLLAIGLQESRFAHRVQVGGPAHGFWQFERGGGVHGVLNHPATSKLAGEICEARNVEPSAPSVYSAIVTDDLLACAFARLLLWSDPAPLPAVGDFDRAFALYLRTWRPGAWSRGSETERNALRKKFERNYLDAMSAIVDAPHGGA